MKQQIRNQLYRDKRQESMESFVKGLRDKASVKIDEGKLAKVQIEGAGRAVSGAGRCRRRGRGSSIRARRARRRRRRRSRATRRARRVSHFRRPVRRRRPSRPSKHEDIASSLSSPRSSLWRPSLPSLAPRASSSASSPWSTTRSSSRPRSSRWPRRSIAAPDPDTRRRQEAVGRAQAQGARGDDRLASSCSSRRTSSSCR